MIVRPKTFRRSLPAGATLIEAVAGIALMGTLLVSMLVAGGRMQKQSRRAELRQTGCRIADSLIASWYVGAEKVPRNGSGEVPGHKGWRWRTALRTSRTAEPLGAEVVRVALFAPGDDPQHAPIVHIDLLVATTKDQDATRIHID